MSRAEERAARAVDVVPEMQAALTHTNSFAILSGNGESAAWRFSTASRTSHLACRW